LPLQLEHTFSAGEAGALSRFRVVPVDSWGEQGVASNEVELPVSAPEIHSVTPTEWYTGEECTFTAAVSGTRPLNFSWDFGGGADPNEVTGDGDEVSGDVTLGEPAEYAASITVSNLYGEDTYPFTLTISEREAWAHTWGGGYADEGYGVSVDNGGNVYVAGTTFSFGVGNEDFLLLKYSSDGDLLWQKTWGGTQPEEAWAISLGASGNVYVTGYTTSFGSGIVNAFVLDYSSGGDLVWQKTWSGDAITEAHGVATDSAGNIYVGGTAGGGGNSTYDAFVLKYGSDGSLLWQRTWGGSDGEYAQAVSVDAGGDVYVGGVSGKYNIGYGIAFLLKYSSDGELLWQRTWEGSAGTFLHGMSVDDGGNVYLVGGRGDAFLVKYSPEGLLLLQKTWGGECMESSPMLLRLTTPEAYS